MAGGHSHRATLGKSHKPFKSKHATKGQLKNQYKGKVEKAFANNKPSRVLSKIERKNTAKQLKSKKIADTTKLRKVFEGANGAEKIVSVISLTQDILAAHILRQLLAAENKDKAPANTDFEAPFVATLRVERFKCSVKFILPDQTDLIAILDAAKVSDYVVLGFSAQEEVIRDYGEQILRALIAQGVATPIGVIPNLVLAYPKKNLQADVRQSLDSYFHHFFPADDSLYAMENSNEATNCLRNIAQKLPKPVNWRDSRGYLVASDAYWHVDGDGTGVVVVEGTVRGAGFNSDRLVHITDHGDFQVDHIEQVPCHKNDVPHTYAPTAEQDTLDKLNAEEVDMSDEYAWDPEQSDMGVRMEGKPYFSDAIEDCPRRFKVPQGTSLYQSKWLLDDVLEGVSDVEEADDDAEMICAREEVDMDVFEPVESECEPTEAGDAQSEMFVELSAEDEENQLRQFREHEREDREFPDELELAPSELARERFREYRGVKSLGSCDWDWDEQSIEKPSVYGRLLRINNYKASKNKALKDAARYANVVMGTRVRLYIRAPKYVLDAVDMARAPFVVYALLAHEHKLAVVNLSFKTWEDYEKPMPSGETLVVQYGFQRQVISPVFNQASNSANNVHKHERFAHEGDLCIATALAPVMFYNAPAIYFRPAADGRLEIVGQGTFLNCDHTRVMAERAVLTGHAVKIHKRLITVRYMFFNPEDIHWFKAVPLFTKSGRTGFIKESLGTHGYFKATFDGRLSAQDVIGMALYKRVWPAGSQLWTRWT